MQPARFIPTLSEEQLRTIQHQGLLWTINHALSSNEAYKTKFEQAGIKAHDVQSLDDLSLLPFTTATDLQQGYPFPLLSVAHDDVVRIHASSGTTGKRKVLAYTQRDLATWHNMMARCYELAGLNSTDRVHIATGYGLWTAGAGFQAGCEHFGATALPAGPAPLEIHLQLLEDMQATCLCSTASMALLLGEELERRGLGNKTALTRCIFGAEPHTPAMRKRFEDLLGIQDSFDISGMTELYGPGAGLECTAHAGIHYWADLYIAEVLDPGTGSPVAPGELGELVITTLCKEAAPLIRYRTHDLIRLIEGPCACGCTMPRHSAIEGRSDDMIIYRGVNIYPGQLASVLDQFPEVGPEYQLVLERQQGRDCLTIRIEGAPTEHTGPDSHLTEAIATALHKHLLARVQVEIVAIGSLPRSAGKTKRVLDTRK